MKFARTAIAGALLALSATTHAAEPFPSKVIRMIVPLAPGGTGDTLARTVGDEMGKALGTNIVVDNRPGSGGLIGTETVASAAPDGYTLINVSPSHVINPALHTRKTYDPIKDFEAVIHIANTYQIIVAHPSLPAKNLKELIDLAKKTPGKLSYGSAGTGSATHLASRTSYLITSSTWAWKRPSANRLSQSPLHNTQSEHQRKGDGRIPLRKSPSIRRWPD